MRPGVSRVVLTVSVLGIASNGCVRWGEQEEQEEPSGCSTMSSSPSDDGYDDDDNGSVDDGADVDDSAGETPEPGDPVPDVPEWPTPWPIDPDAAVVVWGKTGIPTKNLSMVRNMYLWLADVGEPENGSSSSGSTSSGTGGSTSSDGTSAGMDTEGAGTDSGVGTTGTGGGLGSTDGGETDGETDGTGGRVPEPETGVNILWIADCDPRSDEVGCLAGNVQPYFAMVDTLGSVDFKPLSQVDPLAYDVIVADFCGPVSATAVGDMLGDGARVLVLGDTWCVRDGQTSAAAANELLEHIGTRFDGAELYNHDFLVPEDRRVGMLEGVERIDAWGVGLQGVGPEFDALLGTTAGTLLSSRGGE